MRLRDGLLMRMMTGGHLLVWKQRDKLMSKREKKRVKKKQGALLRLLRVHLPVYRPSQKSSQKIGGSNSRMSQLRNNRKWDD